MSIVKLNMYFLFQTKPFCKKYIVVQNEVLFLKIGSRITKLQAQLYYFWNGPHIVNLAYIT